MTRWRTRALDRAVRLGTRPEADERGEWNRRVGLFGENLAALHLRRSGLKTLYRNFRAPKGGEVDIVCRDGDWLVFIEVKTRTSDQYGRPVAAVNRDKQALIVKGAMAWLRELNFPDLKFRFDVVEVVLLEGEAPKIEHLRNVFEMPRGYVY
ncbi:MAG: YraN family protein [Verrucomicrobiae bacterium]|nr:YraN family protein [Verrucomicrobiae bacterium]